MPSTVAVFIPIFNQPQLAAECLQSLQQQTFKDFDVILVDDAGSADYQPLVKTFSAHFPIRYQRNPKNLGALKNMQACIQQPCDQPYKVVFHEDDRMHPQFLTYQVEQLTKNTTAVFSATGMTLSQEMKDCARLEERRIHRCKSKIDLLTVFMRPSNFTFGSVMYRMATLRPLEFELERFNTLADRPYLLEQLDNREVLFIDLPLVNYRPHPVAEDQRAEGLTIDHLFALLHYYGNLIQERPENKAAKKEFLTYATHAMLDSGWRLARKDRRSYLKLIYDAYQQNIFSPVAIRPSGLKDFFRATLLSS